MRKLKDIDGLFNGRHFDPFVCAAKLNSIS